MPDEGLSLQDALRKLAGGDHKDDAYAEGRCMKPPIGCGRPLTEAQPGGFKDYISTKEYLISGLCQSCQDKMEEASRAEEDC